MFFLIFTYKQPCFLFNPLNCLHILNKSVDIAGEGWNFEGEGWNSVRWLPVSNNRLIAQSAENLELFNVSGNQLTEIDANFIQRLKSSILLNISLSSNPCYCVNPQLTFAVENAARITDYVALQCIDGQPINSKCDQSVALQA